MHPALSIVFFTTATGAGYGLLALLGVFAAAGFLPTRADLGIVSLGLAFGLISTGLLASTAHLGRPERAWRAFSQWRSSWLSREAVAASFTFLPAFVFAVGWVFFSETRSWVSVAGLLTAICAVVTICMTGMIYASLKTVARWYSPYTLPGFLIYAGATGATLLNALFQSFGLNAPAIVVMAIIATLIGWGWKRATWRHDARTPATSTTGTATGLPGSVRSIEWPHTEENFVLKEMGFRIARKHSARLRIIAQVLAFALPAFFLSVSLLLFGTSWATVFSLVAAACQLAGMVVERWLFFAEAKHIVMLYYGR